MKERPIWLISLVSFLLLISCEKTTTHNENESTRNITILYTNDEHGWMEPSDPYGGAAAMMGLWQTEEEYIENDHFLILSGGDNWTGPAISTWTKGESMIDVMNAMKYTATAIGNHEFDFGIDILYNRLDQADFSFISANIREKATGEIPDFAQPYIIREINAVNVGIIGLSSISTYTSTHPANVADLDFIAYTEALNEYVPLMVADGAELLIVIAHLCSNEIFDLLPTLTDLGVHLIGGGHCPEKIATVSEGVAIIMTGKNLQSYGVVGMNFDSVSDTMITIDVVLKDNIGGDPDPIIESIVANWQSYADDHLNQIIGYTESTIVLRSPAMLNMIADSWLISYPSADFAFTNRGGIRQDIPAGDIQISTIIGLMPFDNYIMELELTGTEIMAYLDYNWPAIGGLTTIGGYQFFDGTPIDSNTTYNVLINDYMYAANDGNNWSTIDPNPNQISINYRQPVIDWLESINTSAVNPLDNYLDPTPRQ